jgi:pre-peptidase
LKLHGAKLAGALHVWTSFPAQVEVLAAEGKTDDGKERTCKVTVPANTPVGIGGMAIATDSGLTDVIYVMVDDLPSVADNAGNHGPAEAQSISLPTAIDGQSDGTLADYYRFMAKSGERISCEVVAVRLGSDFDALVRVLDASGNELLLADDDLVAGADSRFVFTAPADGSYLLEVRDNRFKPGGQYRLRLGGFPLVSAPLPLMAQRGVPTEVNFCGPLTDRIEPVTILPTSGDRPAEFVAVTAKSRSDSFSSWTTLGVSNFPVISDAQPSKVAAAIDLPCVVSGILAAPRERDVFRLSAKKGVPLRCRAVTRSAGSPAIVSLRLLDPSGKQLGESPVTETDEPVLSFTPTADGSYDLAVEELASRGGNDFVYAVECTTGPQFALVLKNDKNNRLKYSVGGGGAFYLDVQCQRFAYDGPITLAVDCHRPGWQVFNNVIQPKTNETRLYVVPPTDLAAGELTDLRIVGRGIADANEIKTAMSTLVQLRVARPQTPYPPRWHDGSLFVSALKRSAPLAWFTNVPPLIDVPVKEGKATAALAMESTDPKFKDAAITIVPIGLPTGITVEAKKGSSTSGVSYDLNVTVPKNIAAISHVLRCFAYVEIAGQGRAVLSGDIRLNVMAEKTSDATATSQKAGN